MVTREEFKSLVKGMKSIHTNENFIRDADAFNIWFSMLNDLEYSALSAAIQDFMQNETRIPTVADIRKRAVALKIPDFMNPDEAWALVVKAVGKSSYYSEEEFNKLPTEVQKAVGSAYQLKVWATTDNFYESESVHSSFFKKIYASECEKRKHYLSLSPDLQALIDNKPKYGIENNERLGIDVKDNV